MATTQDQISIRIDHDVKTTAEQILSDIGLSMSTAINVFLRKVIQERRIPFELSADPFFCESNIRHLREVARSIDNGTAQLVEHELIED